MRSIVVIAVAVVLSASLRTAPAQEPENQRLSSEAFRRGLKRLGLTDLLDYYVREYPPKDPIEAALLMRELRLNLYSDSSIPSEDRLEALEEATAILKQLIADYPDHNSRFEWQLDVGRDLVFRKAEPYHNNVIFRGGTAEDFQALARITAQALGVFDRLINELVAAEAKIDSLSIRQFEKFAKSGHIERIEELQPKARYFRLWASYYRCLTLEPGSAGLVAPLKEIVDYLNEESKLTTIEHRNSHYQAQSLLLAGMAYRLLGSSDRAEDDLFKAGTVVAAIPDFMERHDLRWVTMFSALERVKNFRDRGQYEMAVRTLDEFQSQLPANSPDQFSLHFALALLKGTVYRAHALALPSNASGERSQLLLTSRRALIDLAREHPRYQNEIYATLFDLLGDVEDPSSLDSFEKNIYISGLLRRAADAQSSSMDKARPDQEKNKLLEQAAQLALAVLQDDSALGLELRPEVLFNLAVCRYEQDRVLEAIEQFSTLAANHPEFGKSRQAAGYALRLSESLYNRATLSMRRTVRPFYLEALRNLLNFYRDLDLAARRQFTYAEVLQEDGRHREAVEQYAMVQADDPRYVEALFRIAECNLFLLRKLAVEGERRAVTSQVSLTTDSVARFQSKLGDSGTGASNRHLAESHLIAAEANMLSPTKFPDQALETLAGFESRFVDELDLLGRAMRIRILAYQALGELEQAAAIIPQYLKQDPQNAGATLQGLLNTFKDEIAQAEESGQTEQAQRKAEDALIVARALHTWSEQSTAGLDKAGRLAFKLEYGEALLRTGRAGEALELFRSVVGAGLGKKTGGGSKNGRALFGLAQAYLLDNNPREALPYFSRLYRDTPEDTDLWWRSFLGEIRCRIALDQDRRTLYNLISQKRVFYPQMGGPKHREQFEQLRTELSGES